MMNLLTRKLEAFGPLPDADKRILDDVIRPAHLNERHIRTFRGKDGRRLKL
jgi:hypothetical protein